MKYIRIFVLSLFLMPFAARAANNDFVVAAQLLSAAKNADIQQVQALVNNGANINYVDGTGLSLVCTALMNKDYRAAQILQMYGADASQCDKQIKQYNSRSRQEESGGLFGGLSSAQSLTLAAAGAAVVIGGVLWLSGVFDSDNSNESVSSGYRPGGDSGNGGGGALNGGTAWKAPTLPYGPMLPNAASEATLSSAMDYYSPTDKSNILYQNFQLMNGLGVAANQKGGQNYLLLMKGYAPLARGYLGMRTIRDLYTYAPVSALFGKDMTLFGIPLGGGRPINVALVTDNGVNASLDSSLRDDKYMPWTTLSGTSSVNSATVGMVSNKYYNNIVSYQNSGSENPWGDFSLEEDTSFDLSGHGTAIHNGYATGPDNLKAKIVGGSDANTNADYFGFMPNGQMTIYRTGGGMGFLAPGDGVSLSGSYTMVDGAFTTDSTITIGGVQYTISKVNGNLFTATNGDDDYVGYIIGNNLYFDSNHDGIVDQMFSMSASGTSGGELNLAKTLQVLDYQNYKAMWNAFELYKEGDAVADAAGTSPASRSAPAVIANASVIDPLRDLLTSTVEMQAVTVTGMLSYINQSPSNPSQGQTEFLRLINKYYNQNNTDDTNGGDYLPATDALKLFGSMGVANSPLLVFSTGSFETIPTNGDNWAGETKEATFENAAPLVWQNLEHLFMSVVAVGLTGVGTSDATSVSGFSPASNSKYELAKWGEKNGDETHYFKARKCGVAGSGRFGVDPWCFAAVGVTDEMAVSAAAGAAGALMSAFGGITGFLSNEQIFVLMALTADGPYLGTNDAGKAFTKETLTAYLQSLYNLPQEDDSLWKSGAKDYLDVFKDVFGYGLINLNRATTPGHTVYYYVDNNIVSASGNAYWRAATNTRFRTSSAFSPRAATISAPFFDILESIDGDLRLPRVWRNEFAIGTGGNARGLYMGDTLGELKTRNTPAKRTQMGAVGFTLATSEKAYDDNMAGIDDVTLDFAMGDWTLRGGYQRHLTDGRSRFSGMTNPILGLASNATTMGADYDFGRLSVGGRAFSGAITDEGILDNDPTIASQYLPAELGRIYGGAGHFSLRGEHITFTGAAGTVRETETLLGAQTGGLLNLGTGNTRYVDAELRWAPTDGLAIMARSTFARTKSNADGQFILGMDTVDSDAYAVGVDAGNFSLTVARPLAVRSGSLRYAYADYDIVEDEEGRFDLNVVDSHTETVPLSPEKRELRLSGEYRHSFGEFTDGAVGFIYRVHPNNTDEFGNESIFMLKMTHRLGI